ncbi:MAG: hypothetical protein ACXACP_13750 [Candidatus Hodarchaeales archaeon]|jgi:hypothetical protein
MKREKPIFAETYFSFGKDCISQSLYFYYSDSAKIYFNLKETGAIKGELDSIQANLQKFIDIDTLHMNDNLIKMEVRKSKLFFKDDKPEFPILFFVVNSSKYNLKEDELNELHLYAKPERIPYSAISHWKTYRNILKVESKTNFTISTNRLNLIFYMTRNEIIGGHERIFII